MSHVSDLNIDELQEMAVHLAPAFRDKFDFSDEKDYARLADHAFNTAKALRKKANQLHDEAAVKDAEDTQKAEKERQLELARRGGVA